MFILFRFARTLGGSWFGLTMCDSQSAPEFTTNCTPDSDRNNLVGSNPNAPNYIGKHPGTAFMEL